MSPISPKAAPVSYENIRSEIARVVTQFPAVVSELIGGYASFDYSLAERPLTFDKHGRLTNSKVCDAIFHALTTGDCERSILVKIFQNLKIYGIDPDCRWYQNVFRALCTQINRQGFRVNLDEVVLSDLELPQLNLTMMTARNAIFSNVKFSFALMSDSDLTGAKFDDVEFRFSKMRRVIAHNVVYENVHFEHVDVSGMITDEPQIIKGYARELRYETNMKMVTISDLTGAVSTEKYRELQEACKLPEVAQAKECLIL